MSLATHVRISSTDFSCRLDAEFFSVKNQKLRSRLARAALSVVDVANVSDGNHGTISGAYVESGRRYLRGTDLSSFFLDDDAPIFIADDTFKGLGRGYVEAGDVLLTIVGASVGQVGIAPASHGPMAASCKLAILRSHKMPSSVLAIFFTTEVGQALLRMAVRGSAQGGIPLDGLKRMPLPTIPERVWKPVARLVADAERMANQARRAYPDAEAELMERLRWSMPAVESAMFNKSISSTLEGGRLDAEFFHPNHMLLERHLRKSGARTLGDVALSYSKGAQPEEYSEEGPVKVVKSKDVTKTFSFDSCECTNYRLWDDNPQARLRSGDLLINATGLGTLGRSAVVPTFGKIKAVAANHVTIWRLDPTQAVSAYVALFLNAPPGQMQADRYQTGSSGQRELYPEHHMKRFLLFLPTTTGGKVDIAWQARLSERLADGLRMAAGIHELLDKARALLTEAIGVLT